MEAARKTLPNRPKEEPFAFSPQSLPLKTTFPIDELCCHNTQTKRCRPQDHKESCPQDHKESGLHVNGLRRQMHQFWGRFGELCPPETQTKKFRLRG